MFMSTKRSITLALAMFVLAIGAAGNAVAVPYSNMPLIGGAGQDMLVRVSEVGGCHLRNNGGGVLGDEVLFPNYSGASDCGTFIFENGELFATDLTENIVWYIGTGTTNLGTYTKLQPVSQGPVSGSGTVADPWRLETRTRAVATSTGTNLDVLEVDTRVGGARWYSTSLTVTNVGTGPASPKLYRGADCGFDDNGQQTRTYGFTNPANGTVGCTYTYGAVGPHDPKTLWVPETPPTAYFVGLKDDLWTAVGQGQTLSNACSCATYLDTAAALQWDLTIPPGQSATVRYRTHLWSKFEPVPGTPPTAAVRDVAGTSCSDAEHAFTDMSTYSSPLTAWAWDFGDGSTSSQRHPRHLFASPGPFTVRLSVTDSAGLTGTTQRQVTPFDASNCCVTFDIPPLMAAWEGRPFSFRPKGTTLTGAPVTWTITGLPQGSSFDASVPEFRWTPAAGDEGVHELQVSGTAGDCTVTTLVNVHVLDQVGPASDFDQDGVADPADDCPGVPDHAQQDSDRDGIGDACDSTPCPGPFDERGRCPGSQQSASPTSTTPGVDRDADGTTDSADNCPGRWNPGQGDADLDSVGDVCDRDRDGDGMPNDADAAAILDNCPDTPNQDQGDVDGDGVGDACQPEPTSETTAPAKQGGPGNAQTAPGPVLVSVLALVAAALARRR